MKCEICGHEGVKTKKDKSEVTLLFTRSEPYEFTVTDCDNCGEGIVCDDHDPNVNKALRTAQAREYCEIYDYFKGRGWITEIERTFGISFGLLERLRKNPRAVSKIELAFMELIRLSPASIMGFDYISAGRRRHEVSQEEVEKYAEENEKECEKEEDDDEKDKA